MQIQKGLLHSLVQRSLFFYCGTTSARIDPVLRVLQVGGTVVVMPMLLAMDS